MQAAEPRGPGDGTTTSKLQIAADVKRDSSSIAQDDWARDYNPSNNQS